VDVGSTTTDLIVLRDGKPAPRGWDDVQRLRTGELVYTGTRRTPVCHLVPDGVCAELFATTLDVYLALGDVPPDASDRDTADGRPATAAFAHARLARMLGGDGETVDLRETRRLALRARDRQYDQLRGALKSACEWCGGVPPALVLSGSGGWLVPAVVGRMAGWEDVAVISLADRLGPAASSAACAHAVAVLADEGVER
jgi:probable H4MPT-linked C1 transfer pathway protein